VQGIILLDAKPQSERDAFTATGEFGPRSRVGHEKGGHVYIQNPKLDRQSNATINLNGDPQSQLHVVKSREQNRSHRIPVLLAAAVIAEIDSCEYNRGKTTTGPKTKDYTRLSTFKSIKKDRSLILWKRLKLRINLAYERLAGIPRC